MSTQTIGVELNVRADGAAAQAMARLAENTRKAVKAEEDLNKLVQQRQKMTDANQAGRANDNVAAAKTRLLGNYNEDNRKKVEQAYARKADLELGKEVRAAREEQKKAAKQERETAREVTRLAAAEKKELANYERQQKQTQRENERITRQAQRDRSKAMADQSSGQKALLGGLLGQAGLGAGVSTFGNITALGEAAKLSGYSGVGGVIGKAALPIALAAGGLEAGKTASRLSQDEYLTDAQRERGFVRSNVVGRYISDTFDTFSGRARGMERAEEQRELRNQVGGVQIQRQEFLQGIANRRGQAAAAMRGAEGLKGTFRGNTSRDSVESRLAYEQESRMLPLRKQTARAEQEYATAKYAAMNAQTTLNKLETDGNTLAEKRSQLQGRLNNVASGPQRQDILYQLESNKNLLDANITQRQKARDFAANAVQTREDALTGVNAARTGERRGTLENLQMREGRAESRAENLGMLGRVGLQKSQIALGIIESVGFENAPEEFKREAAAAFPEKVRQMAIAAGQGMEGDANVSSAEYNDRLGNLRKQVDEAEYGVEASDVANTKDAASRNAKSIDEAAKALENFTDRIRLLIDQFDNDQRARRSANN